MQAYYRGEEEKKPLKRSITLRVHWLVRVLKEKKRKCFDWNAYVVVESNSSSSINISRGKAIKNWISLVHSIKSKNRRKFPMEHDKTIEIIIGISYE